MNITLLWSLQVCATLGINMNILVIGSGGREHALAWKIAQSNKADKIFVAPGNAGTYLEPNLKNIDIEATDTSKLIDFAKKNNIGLTIVGPEVPLVNGIVDQFQAAGLSCFGPSKNAAQLEGSKTFSKDFLKRHNIPSADYASFTQVNQAIAYLAQTTLPIVIKADGLAAGKGVIIANTQAQAESAIKDMLADNKFGEAGSRVVIEEFLQGEEASFIVLVDGKNFLPMATSQDHKARDNGDLGPNTGGMGAYSPAPIVTDKIYQRTINEVIKPTIKGMAEEGNPFVGFLYAGLMIDNSGTPKVLEFNVRFGDPETQPIMLRLKSDLLELCQAALSGTLDQTKIEWDERSSLGIVLAAGGYPEQYASGDEINNIPDETTNTKVFYAGTKMEGDKILTAGGRVLCACALGGTIKQAQKSAYQLVEKIKWNNIYYRTDIGFKAIK